MLVKIWMSFFKFCKLLNILGQSIELFHNEQMKLADNIMLTAPLAPQKKTKKI